MPNISFTPCLIVSHKAGKDDAKVSLVLCAGIKQAPSFHGVPASRSRPACTALAPKPQAGPRAGMQAEQLRITTSGSVLFVQGLGNHAPSIVSSDAVTMRKATEELRELAHYLHLFMSGPCPSHRPHSGRLLPPVRAAAGHGRVPRARSHLCRTHWCLSQPQKTNSAMGLFCTVPTLRAEPLV